MENATIIIPAYNEEKSIGVVLDDLKNVMNGIGAEYEIIVVDDGSEDRTAEVVQTKNVKLLRQARNKGYGSALKYGIRNARYNNIVITDADGTYPNREIPKLLEEIDHYDMVVGARIREGAKIPMIRRPPKWVLSKLADYLSETKIPDLNSGLRVFKKDTIEKYFHLLPSGFSFTTTITLALLSNDHSVKYLPIEYLKRTGKSKIRPIRDTLNFVQLIIRTVMYFNPLKVFVPLSLLLFLLSAFVLVYSFFFTPKVMDITTIVLFVSAVQILAIGMIADLIDKRSKR